MSVRERDTDDSDQSDNQEHDQEQPLFGEETDEWGRPRPTEQGRDFPPEHSAIEICHRKTADDGFTVYHPDELEINREAVIMTDDPEAHFPIKDCE